MGARPVFQDGEYLHCQLSKGLKVPPGDGLLHFRHSLWDNTFRTILPEKTSKEQVIPIQHGMYVLTALIPTGFLRVFMWVTTLMLNAVGMVHV